MHDADADKSLTDCFASFMAEQQSRIRKRKRAEQQPEESQNMAKQRKDDHVSIETANSHRLSTSGQPASEPAGDDAQVVSSSAEQSKQNADPAQQPASAESTAEHVSDKAAGGKHGDGDSQAHTPIHSFYLLKPHTPSSQPRVLIPLDSSSTLTAALSSHVVLEYPTIKVLPRQATDAPLPDGFILEEDYFRQTQQDVQELEALIGPDGEVMTTAKVRKDEEPAEEAHGRVSKGTGDIGPLDDKRLLEVLTRDLNARNK